MGENESGPRGETDVKTCPYCAEEIQDAAVKCRFCGSDVAPKAPRSQGIIFRYFGDRYLMGVTVTATPTRLRPKEFAIWDGSEPGPPVLRYPLTTAGWSEAWGRFTELQPVWKENSDPPACPRCGNPMELVSDGDRGLRMAKGFMVLGAIGALALGSTKRFVCRRDNTWI